jgi:hypothetical protein
VVVATGMASRAHPLTHFSRCAGYELCSFSNSITSRAVPKQGRAVRLDFFDQFSRAGPTGTHPTSPFVTAPLNGGFGSGKRQFPIRWSGDATVPQRRRDIAFMRRAVCGGPKSQGEPR